MLRVALAAAPLALLAACGGSAPLAVTAPTVGASAEAVCAAVIGSLPKDLTADLPARSTNPVSPDVRAWGSGSKSAVLTCGVDPPTKLQDVSQTTVDDLDWGTPLDADGEYRTRDRAVVVELQISDGVLPFDVLASVSMQILQLDPVDPVAAASEAAASGTSSAASSGAASAGPSLSPAPAG